MGEVHEKKRAKWGSQQGSGCAPSSALICPVRLVELVLYTFDLAVFNSSLRQCLIYAHGI